MCQTARYGEDVPELVSADAQRYAREHTTAFPGSVAAAAAWTQENTSAPVMMSGLAEARLLEILIRLSGARHVLEIGTFTGVGTLSMAAALPEAGRVVTLELDAQNAAAARAHFAASPYEDRIDLIEGDALRTLDALSGPFDLVYIDAWKSDYPAYYEAVRPKLAPRGVIVADNMFRDGRVLDASVTDPSTEGIREFADRVQRDHGVHNVLLTIGDGVMVCWPSSER